MLLSRVRLGIAGNYRRGDVSEWNTKEGTHEGTVASYMLSRAFHNYDLKANVEYRTRNDELRSSENQEHHPSFSFEHSARAHAECSGEAAFCVFISQQSKDLLVSGLWLLVPELSRRMVPEPCRGTGFFGATPVYQATSIISYLLLPPLSSSSIFTITYGSFPWICSKRCLPFSSFRPLGSPWG